MRRVGILLAVAAAFGDAGAQGQSATSVEAARVQGADEKIKKRVMALVDELVRKPPK